MRAIDEAISHCLKVGKFNKAMICDIDDENWMAVASCKLCAEEYHQFAGWLMELKHFKSLKCGSCNEYDIKDNWCYKHGIDRAYDDFCSDWED